MDKDFGNIFNKLCEQSQKSNVEIAKSLGVSKATIGRWRSGERTPKLSKLNEIAKYFDTNVLVFANDDKKNIDNIDLSKEKITVYGKELEELTEEELKDVAEYIKFIKSKRK